MKHHETDHNEHRGTEDLSHHMGGKSKKPTKMGKTEPADAKGLQKETLAKKQNLVEFNHRLRAQ